MDKVYTITFYDSNGHPLSEATFNVPDPDSENLMDCFLTAARSGWVPGTTDIGFTATEV